MKFDAETIREEMRALEEALKISPKDQKLANSYVSHARKLRDLEYQENGYVTARNGVTGY